MPHSRKDRSGAALVEFAMVLPIVVLLFSGMVEVSRVLLLQHTADTAAYEGARAGMVPGASALEAQQAAEELLKTAGLNEYQVTVTPSEILEETALISVHVHVPIAPNSWMTPTRFIQTPVDSEVSLYCERSPIVQLTGIPEMKIKKNNMGGRKPKR